MSNIGANFSEGFIQQLYLSNAQPRQPVVQIIDFQQSQSNDKQIILRVSDRITFIDCTLSGPYQIDDGRIASTRSSGNSSMFGRYDFVKITDYFSKVDETRICKLKIIIRKMAQLSVCGEMFGLPQEVHQFIVNNRLKNGLKGTEKQKYSTSNLKGNNPLQGGNNQSTKLRKSQIYPPPNEGKSPQTSIKIESNYEEDPIRYLTSAKTGQESRIVPLQNQNQSIGNPQTNIFPFQNNCQTYPPNNKTRSKTKNQEHADNSQYHNSQTKEADEPLTLQQIMNKVEGFLIGRLIRFKCAIKETKDGLMTVIYLGFLDKYDQIVRVHLAGRLAMNNEKTLKKGRCYYVKGFEIVSLKGNVTQIRLRDKQYKIYEVSNQDLTKELQAEYFHWDHQNEEVESEYVDVIGIIDDIQEKATYNQGPANDIRTVIRIVVKNVYKSVRISFWTDQIKMLESLNLKKKECVIIEDIKKKQSKYYDFNFESNLIHLQNEPELRRKYDNLIPVAQDRPQPQNIKQLSQTYEAEPTNSKLRTINAYLFRIHQNKILYKICDDCKKKVQKQALSCQQCQTQNLLYKFNCPFQFSDYTGSIVAILFDSVAQRLFNRTAVEISEMEEYDLQQFIETFYYREFTVVIQNRNQRIIVRSIEPLEPKIYSQIASRNAQIIQQHLKKGIW